MSAAPPHLIRTIGRWSLTALMVNSIIGGGIFGLPSIVAARVGKFSPFACLIAGAGIAVIAGCLSEVGSQFPAAGGPYIYARATLGRFWGIQIAWMTWLSRIASSSATANLFATYLGQFTAHAAQPIFRLMILTVLIGALAFVNFIGVRSGTRLSDFFTSVKVLLLAAFIIAGLIWLSRRGAVVPAPLPHSIEIKDWFAAILLMVFAYGGFESVFFASGEARDPRRDIPPALLLAIGLVTLIYTLVHFVVMVTLADPASSLRPLADAARQVLGNGAASLIAIAALISIYGYLSANMLHTPRLTYALAEQGDFPKMFARVHPRFHTPHISILVYTILLLGFTLIGNFQWNITLSSVGRLLTYGSIAIALPLLRRQRPHADAFRLPGGMAFSVLGVSFCLVLLSRTSFSNLSIVMGTVTLASLNWLAVRRSGGSLHST